MFDIVWEGAARGTHGGEHDEDWGLDLSDLLRATAGCGYDAPEQPQPSTVAAYDYTDGYTRP
jgi:hypothetical protein